VWWPGINNDVKNIVATCNECALWSPSQAKETFIAEKPERPMQVVYSDMFQYAGENYLVLSDKYSGWPCVGSLGTSATAVAVIAYLRQWFSELGIPNKLITDGGSQFRSREFEQWCLQQGIHHQVTSPYHPQSNGQAEACVKIIKHLLAKSSSSGNLNVDEFYDGLLEYRNTPRKCGYSPAQVLFGRCLRTKIPVVEKNLSHTCIPSMIFRNKRTMRPLPILEPGQRVRVQDPLSKRWPDQGEII